MPAQGSAPPGLLDPGPYLHLDQDLLGNQGTIDKNRQGGGTLSFDNPDPSMSRGTGVGQPAGCLDTTGILERIAGQGPNPLTGSGPGAGPGSKLPGFINPAGVGFKRGNWNVGFRPKLSTDGDLDDPGKRDRAQRTQQDEQSEAHDRRSVPPK